MKDREIVKEVVKLATAIGTGTLVSGLCDTILPPNVRGIRRILALFAGCVAGMALQQKLGEYTDGSVDDIYKLIESRESSDEKVTE